MKLEPGMVVRHKHNDGRKGVLRERHVMADREFWRLDVTHPDGTLFRNSSWFAENIIPFTNTTTNKEAAKVFLSEEW